MIHINSLLLDAKGGIQGGLELSFHIGEDAANNLDPDFRRNDVAAQNIAVSHAARYRAHSLQVCDSTTIRQSLLAPSS